jgi:hypothetical protein
MPQMRYRFATNIVHSLHAESMTMIRARYAMCMRQKCVLTFCLGNENQYPNFVMLKRTIQTVRDLGIISGVKSVGRITDTILGNVVSP